MINDKRVIAIIPSRAGSKGVIGKNYKRILGKPLIDWSMNAASMSEFIDTTVVSSNCEKSRNRCVCHPSYCQWSKHSGAGEKRFKMYHVQRPENLCLDESLTEPAMIHAIDFMKENYGMEFDYVVLLQPTSPARRNNLIDNCLKEMVKGGYDSCMTVSSHTPFFWHRENGVAIPNYDPNNRPRRQDVPENEIMMHDNGNVYIVSVDNLKENGRVGSNPLLYETRSFESMQIDTEEDFSIMEAIAKSCGGFINCGI